MGSFFHTVLYTPLYNLLIFLVDLIPGADIGIAVILTTILVRLILWPLSMSAVRTQKAMKAMEPEMKEVRTKYKDDQQEQMKQMMALYKKYDVHPFASLLPVFIQLPIIIGLYWVFRTESLPQVDTSVLYSFVHAPEAASALFLGFMLITTHSYVLAILAALAQFAQSWYAIPVPPASTEVGSAGADFARALAIQTRYVLPLIIGVVAYTSGAIALYFITSSIISIVQEWLGRRTKRAEPVAA